MVFQKKRKGRVITNDDLESEDFSDDFTDSEIDEEDLENESSDEDIKNDDSSVDNSDEESDEESDDEKDEESDDEKDNDHNSIANVLSHANEKKMPKYDIDELISPDMRQSSRILSEFEVVRILGARAAHLSNGAEPFITINGLSDPIDIAWEELLQKQLPYIIRRNMVVKNTKGIKYNKTELWKIDEIMLPKKFQVRQ